jgi:hypothetical protein
MYKGVNGNQNLRIVHTYYLNIMGPVIKFKKIF